MVMVLPFSAAVLPGVSSKDVTFGCDGCGDTVTFALPVMVSFVAVTIAVPSAAAVNVVVAIPLSFVIASAGATSPTVVLPLDQVMLILAFGIPSSIAVAVNI
ncbi:Uncharacterised protein [uncultured archaeon]|nr:Uncharacterised protein [uncultured archaeon]